jgi:hypothetical protein|tara:strand:- start:495 stop:767 length:273 start_codon:yes stop_codon:yes gene_type:complete
MKKPNVGTTLGKCIFDNGVIVEGSGLRSDYATLRQGRWICGECLLGLLDTAFEAFLQQQEDSKKETEKLIRKVSKYGWKVNPETGKLEKL